MVLDCFGISEWFGYFFDSVQKGFNELYIYVVMMLCWWIMQLGGVVQSDSVGWGECSVVGEDGVDLVKVVGVEGIFLGVEFLRKWIFLDEMICFFFLL